MELSISQTLKVSTKFEKNRTLLSKAERLLELSRRAYRVYTRKNLELESNEFIIDRDRTKMQAVVAFNQSERCYKYFKKVIKQIHHS